MNEKQKLVVIGNGMAGARFVEETVMLGGRDLYDITVIGEETCGNYNRILLSSVLSGSHDPDDIFINPLNWYAENGVDLHAGRSGDRRGPQGKDGLRIRRSIDPLRQAGYRHGQQRVRSAHGTGFTKRMGHTGMGPSCSARWRIAPGSSNTPTTPNVRPSSVAACSAWKRQRV